MTTALIRIDDQTRYEGSGDEFQVLSGLNLAQLDNIPLKPDEDLIVAETASGDYFAVHIPAKFAEIDARFLGKNWEIAFDGDAKQTYAGTVRRFADNPGKGVVLSESLTIGENSGKGMIMAIASPDDAKFQHEPFIDNIIVESDGKYYHIIVPADFTDITEGDEISVSYALAKKPGQSGVVSFTGTVNKIHDTEKKQKYALAQDVEVTVVSATGAPVAADNIAAMTMTATVREKIGFKVGDTVTLKQFTHHSKHLTKQLAKLSWNSGVQTVWAEEGKTIRIFVTVVLPPATAHVQFAPGMDEAWADENITESEIAKAHAEVSAVVADHDPYSAKEMKRLNRHLKRFSRESNDWELTRTETIGVDGEGVLRVNPVIAPEAKGFDITVDGEILHAESLEEEQDINLADTVPARKSERAWKKAFKAVSDHYASAGKILAVERDGKLVPYVPESRKSNDRWVFTAPGANEDLPITAITAPKYVDWTPASDNRHKRIGPTANEVLAMFHDMYRSAKATSASINDGLKELTLWYTRNGFSLVNSQLDVAIVGETLQLKADVYRMAEEVTLVADPGDGFADKRAKHLKYIEREFKRIKVGEAFNAFELKNAIMNVDARFHYKAFPQVSIDPQTGAVKITVVLVQNKKLAGGLEALQVAGGYSGMYGVAFSGSQSSTTHTGFRTSGSVSLYPQAEMAGAGVKFSTPKDENGGQIEAGLSGQYYLDYISSLGASVNYITPIGDSPFSFIVGGGLEYLMSTENIDGTDALYFKPSVGVQYSDGKGLSAKILAGPRINTQGAVFAGIDASVSKRVDLNKNDTLYAEVYAKSGMLFGGVPEAALYQTAPFVLHGAYMQAPLGVNMYAGVGAAIMVELPGGFVDIGLGTSAGVIGPYFSIGAGLIIRIKVLFPVRLMIGPAYANGFFTPITVSAGN